MLAFKCQMMIYHFRGRLAITPNGYGLAKDGNSSTNAQIITNDR